jgi:hypothetical protein
MLEGPGKKSSRAKLMPGEMLRAQQLSAAPAQEGRATGMRATSPKAYIFLIIVAAIVAYFFQLRTNGIFACQSSGYSGDSFLGECSARQYGNYEHGAFWFGLEPAALEAAARAKVLFLGDSRLQIAMSTPETSNWFGRTATSFYLLGFGGGENMNFTVPLLDKLKPQATTFIINADNFFDTWYTIPYRGLLNNPDSEDRYKYKRRWQEPHRYFCDRFPSACGNNFATFRSVSNGMYQMVGDYDADGHPIKGNTVSYDRNIHRLLLEKSIPLAEQFLDRTGARRECVILTIIPYAGTRIETARAFAAAVGMTFVAPDLDGLQMFDPTHLDPRSARAWAQKFYEAAGPTLERCIAAKPVVGNN